MALGASSQVTPSSGARAGWESFVLDRFRVCQWIFSCRMIYPRAFGGSCTTVLQTVRSVTVRPQSTT